jgi:hypothetical protein
MNIHAITEELLDAVFHMQSVLRLHNKDQLDKPVNGEPASTVALQVVGSDEKGRHGLEDKNTGTWPSRLGGVSNLKQ